MRLQDFLENKAPNQEGLYLGTILQNDNDFWEQNHNFIQWLFPTKKRSMFNPKVPTAKDGMTAPNMPQCFDRFKAFLLETDWQHSNNHNLRRITRVLDSLEFFGYKDIQQEFKTYLKEELLKHPCIEESAKYWNLT